MQCRISIVIYGIFSLLIYRSSKKFKPMDWDRISIFHVGSLECLFNTHWKPKMYLSLAEVNIWTAEVNKLFPYVRNSMMHRYITSQR